MVLPAAAALFTSMIVPMTAGAPAVAVTAGTPGVAAARASVCRVTDDRLTEISGLLVDGTGYVVVNDGADDPDGRRVFFLNRRCKVVRTVAYPSRPRDTEDLARGPDGTIWIGDIGDNGGTRETIALWRLSPGASKPSLFRLTYPDGAHDAEALLIAGDGTPVVITKDPVTAGLYSPDGPLTDDTLATRRATPMRRVGDVAVPVTGTSNPFGFPGRLVVTGAGMSADGSRVVLRSYADAFVFDVTEGDVVGALTGGSSRTVALPDEPQGESVTYGADGRSLLTVSEGRDVPILRYPLGEQAPGAAAPPGSAPGGAARSGSAAEATPTGPPSSPGSVAAPASAPAPVGVSAARRDGLPVGAGAAATALIVAGIVLGVLVARRRRA